ncbi:MAG TPA: hypothetical protein PKL15_09955 [Saprospiraceae bacterium]|nr:hypothetical protein [Saprospiraceae bacterium]
MKLLFTLSFFFILSFSITQAQVRLVESAPNDSIWLDCQGCTLTVNDVFLQSGRIGSPFDLRKSEAPNLLHWRSYDDIIKQNVITTQPLPWRANTQLLEDVPEREMLSLQINLDWADTLGNVHKIFLIISGITKTDLVSLPLESTYDEETGTPFRFSAFASVKNKSGELESFDAIEGACQIDKLDTKTGAVSGQFDFTGNCIGISKHTFFINGHFKS